MDTPRHSEKNKGKTALSSERPVDISDWNSDHVKQWMLEIQLDTKGYADIRGINGADLLHLKEAYPLMRNLSLNAIELIIQKIDLNDMESCGLKPYPFNRYDATYRYTENSILDVTETGPLDLIQPCHEFKAFTDTKEYTMEKYRYEVIRFAAACMNSRTNGTIHFGVEDKPHGRILGVGFPKNDAFADWQKDAIEKHFKLKDFQKAKGKKNVQTAGEEDVQKPDHVKIAKMCIKPPRFVEVLKADMTFSEKYVIEVDIEPSSIVCKELHFTTTDLNKSEKDRQKKGDKSLVIRDGSSSKLIKFNSPEYNEHIARMPQLCQLREDAEEKHLSVVKIHAHGSALCEMITGGTHSMDTPNFTSYIVVANKSHPDQLENLDFLLGLNLVAVLDFDPQSAENGLNNKILKQKTFKVPENIKNNWYFCNVGKTPSDDDTLITEKGSSVRDVISLLCEKKDLPRKKSLVIFLLLSQVSKASDPLLQTFSMFQQELRGQYQILCITDNETSFTHWNDLIKKRHKTDMSKCIYELSFAEINGTVLNLWSELRKSMRFLPCGGGSKVVLSKETEESLHMLSILCVNQCDEGHKDKQLLEENFYKGGKASWWNFYYSEQPGSGSASVIKRDKLDYIVETIPNMLNQKRACVCFNIFHPPGWGGTTLAMHVLWTLKEKFRCAVLKDTTDDLTTAAKQVVQLLTYEAKGKPTRHPVLLMTDHFLGIHNVQTLQDQIEEECLNQSIFSKSPQVIIVNCQRVESCEPTEATVDAVFIPSFLSEKEQKLFEEKLEEFKKNNINTETFYVSMVAKSFSLSYIQDVVKNTLKDFNFEHKHAKLFAVLVLLHVYSKNALLSVSTCEEFLGLQTKAESCNVEDAFEKFSSLLKRCTNSSSVTFESMSVIHSTVAQQCLEELFASHKVTKAQIANLLLTTDLFYENTQGQKFMQNVQDMLVKRKNSAEHEDFSFSALIQDIMKQTPGSEETVLLNAEKRLREKEAIFQLLARYYCIKKQDFTFNNDPIKPDNLDRFLTLAKRVAEACKKTQQTPKEEAVTEAQKQNDYNTYDTAGHLGELQTAATAIEILQKIPFKSGFTNSNWLTQVFLGKITIKGLSETENPELKHYCDVLQRHEHFLLLLKETMKQHLDFFNNLFVNLVPLSAGEDKQNDLTKCKVSSYFQQYTELFCGKKCELDKNKDVNQTGNVEQMRQFLESNKGDSYAGLLEYLYKEDSASTASTLEKIIQIYKLILASNEARLMDTVNFIYTNVILAKVKPDSECIMPYKDLCKLLEKTDGSILPLYYIKVLLLWNTKNDHDLQDLVSKMKESYLNELKPWSNGKKAAVHFYLGKGKDYNGLICHSEINSGSEQNILTQWDDENTWKKMKESKKLCKVFGTIDNNLISVKHVKVDPIYRSQSDKTPNSKVQFFIGFSMNGPVALDIYKVIKDPI